MKPLVLFLCVLTSVATMAQDTRPSRPESRPVNDPFRADVWLKQLLGERPAAPADDGFRPLAERPALPAMHLRGLVKVQGRTALAALIEVADVGTYVVRENEKLAISIPAHPGTSRGSGATRTEPTSPAVTEPPRAGDADERRARANASTARPAERVTREQVPVVLRIQHVGTDGVMVEIGTLGEYLIIR